MAFVANFIRFPAVQKFENRLRSDKVTKRLMVETFLRHSVHNKVVAVNVPPVDSKFRIFPSDHDDCQTCHQSAASSSS